MAYATGDFGAWQQAKDERKALRWYARAAEQGDAEARYNLGFMLLLGEGTKADPDAAVALLEQAAQADRYDAAKLLADLYDGWGVERGVPRNAARAAYWRARVES
jgi:TPR repeat protein